MVKSTRGKRSNGENAGIIRLEFPGYSGEDTLEEISWDEFFKSFDENHLALVYQDHTAAGERSNLNKLIHRDRSK